MKKPHCKHCGSDEHYSIMCYQRPRTAIQSKKKAVNRVGKVAAKWIETRHEWIHSNPGPWTCYICGDSLDLTTMTLDHIKSRSRHPELRFVLSNLAPCCSPCNQEKGSKDIAEMRES